AHGAPLDALAGRARGALHEHVVSLGHGRTPSLAERLDTRQGLAEGVLEGAGELLHVAHVPEPNVDADRLVEDDEVQTQVAPDDRLHANRAAAGVVRANDHTRLEDLTGHELLGRDVRAPESLDAHLRSIVVERAARVSRERNRERFTYLVRVEGRVVLGHCGKALTTPAVGVAGAQDHLAFFPLLVLLLQLGE